MKPPLFILAPPRSFTSLTCTMLGCHPQMFGLPEVNLFAADTVAGLHELYSERRRLQYGLLRSLAELAFSEQTEEAVDAARDWLLENKDLSTAEVFRTMQHWAGDVVLVDKSPLHVFMPESLRRIEASFPDARYLHLTRHPGTTTQSALDLRKGMVEKFAGPSQTVSAGNVAPDPDLPEKLWLRPHLAILEFLEDVDRHRQMRLRGESFLSQPTVYLPQIAEWLEVRTDNEAVSAMLKPENSPFAGYGPSNAPFGNDPNFLERPQLRPYQDVPRALTWDVAPGNSAELSESVRAYGMMFGY